MTLGTTIPFTLVPAMLSLRRPPATRCAAAVVADSITTMNVGGNGRRRCVGMATFGARRFSTGLGKDRNGSTGVPVTTRPMLRLKLLQSNNNSYLGASRTTFSGVGGLGGLDSGGRQTSLLLSRRGLASRATLPLEEPLARDLKLSRSVATMPAVRQAAQLDSPSSPGAGDASSIFPSSSDGNSSASATTEIATPLAWQMLPIEPTSEPSPPTQGLLNSDFLSQITEEIFAGADPIADQFKQYQLREASDTIGKTAGSLPTMLAKDSAMLMTRLESGQVDQAHGTLIRMFGHSAEYTMKTVWRDPRLHYGFLKHLFFEEEDWAQAWDWYCISIGRKEPMRPVPRKPRYVDLGLHDYSTLDPVDHGSLVLATMIRGMAWSYMRVKEREAEGAKENLFHDGSRPTWEARGKEILRHLEILISDVHLLFGTTDLRIWNDIFGLSLEFPRTAEQDWTSFRTAAGLLGVDLPKRIPEKAVDGGQGDLEGAPDVGGKKKAAAVEAAAPDLNIAEDADESTGVALVRELLSHLSELNDTPYNNQLALESSVKAMAHFESQLQSDKLKSAGILRMNSKLGKLMWEWHSALKAVLAKDFKVPKQGGRGIDHMDLISRMDPDILASVTIIETLREIQRSGLPAFADVGLDSPVSLTLTAISSNIGRAIELEHDVVTLQKFSNRKKTGSKLDDILKNTKRGPVPFASLIAIRNAAARHEREHNERSVSPIEGWALQMRVKVGAYLLDRLIKVAKMESAYGAVSCFAAGLQGRKFRKHRVAVLTVAGPLAKLLLSDAISSEPIYLPMLVPPKPWVGFESGGYYTVPVPVVRLASSENDARHLILNASDKGMLDRVYFALDVLGSQPWQVNKAVLNVVTKLWQTKEPVAGLPSGEPVAIPPGPDPEDFEKLGAQQYYLLRGLHDSAAKAELERYSLRASESYAIEIAKKFASRTIYFPHNMDFRGRVYPIPVHLNHMRNDLTRGMLMFADARRLGPEGVRWLFIHVANVCGVNKMDLDSRKRWTEEHLEDIMDSADNPLNGKRWWMDSEKPFQCLAACVELTNALRHPEGAENYKSCLPVHQDGTCNGLQHYSALGGDYEGAKQVNVLPGPKPADVYTSVTEAVSKLVDADYAEAIRYEAVHGVPSTNPNHHAAKLVHGRVLRKTLKQTVMTNTYGVTIIGAREQIFNRLKEQFEKDEISASEMHKCALYLARKTFESLGQTFEGAKKLQNWMNDTARLITKSWDRKYLSEEDLVRVEVCQKMGFLAPNRTFVESDPSFEGEEDELATAANSSPTTTLGDEYGDGLQKYGFDDMDNGAEGENPNQATGPTKPVAWTSPIGLPIVQPYRDMEKVQLSTALSHMKLYDPNKPGHVNSRKQASAFPPNFVHSLDASHMFFTAISMKREGLAFAAVHDSFWTHAADVSTMGRIIREEFVRLHDEGDTLKSLRKEFMTRYGAQRSQVTIGMTMEQARAVENEVARILGTRPVKVRRRTVLNKNHNVYISVAPEGQTDETSMEVWPELQIPELPERGWFDLRQVMDSQYFFH